MSKSKFFLFLILLFLSIIVSFFKIYLVLSGSMEPLIKAGSLVFTKSVNPISLKVGDIIAFNSPNNSKDTILHRISSIKSTKPLRFSTKGDHNNTLDQWDVTELGIKGQYLFSIPYIGYLISLLHYPLGFILLICLPALFLIILELLKIKNNLLSLVFIVSLLSFSLPKTFALYTSSAHISDLTFSIGKVFPIHSSINLNDNNVQNTHNFDISSSADDILVTLIKLYYSFNYGPWLQFSETVGGHIGDFPFNSPFGDGLYSFESIATDSSGNTEDKVFDYYNNQIKVDTVAPSTNLNNQFLPEYIYNGQNYLINGDFEDGMNAWFVGSSLGDHHIVNIGTTNNAFILGSDTKTINGTDSLYQIVSLPSSASATLNFSFRFFSYDTADFDHFNVNLTDLSGTNILENILNFGNLNSNDFNYDSGWITQSRSLNQFANQTFKLLFSLTDIGVGETSNSWVFLDDIKISTLDTRVGDTSPISYLSTDLGSIIIDSPVDTTLISGENDLSFNALMDSSANQEIVHHQSILVLSPLVLNKIDKNKISLFNNNWEETIDLTNYFYSVNDGPLISIDNNLNIILPTSLPDSCQIKLFKDSNLIDSVSVTDLNSVSWSRSSDGLGPWVKINSPPSFNLEPRLSASKITLTVSGLATTLADMSYTIDFTDSSGQQEIYGQILPNTIDNQGTSSRDFYLGTCSSGGTCLPVQGLGSSFVVTFSNLPPKTFIFN